MRRKIMMIPEENMVSRNPGLKNIYLASISRIFREIDFHKRYELLCFDEIFTNRKFLRVEKYNKMRSYSNFREIDSLVTTLLKTLV